MELDVPVAGEKENKVHIFGWPYYIQVKVQLCSAV